MSKLLSLIVGYFIGFIVGTFSVFFIIGWFYYNLTKASPPTSYQNIESEIYSIYELAPDLFAIGFIVGFLSGGTATNEARKKYSTRE